MSNCMLIAGGDVCRIFLRYCFVRPDSVAPRFENEVNVAKHKQAFVRVSAVPRPRNVRGVINGGALLAFGSDTSGTHRTTPPLSPPFAVVLSFPCQCR